MDGVVRLLHCDGCGNVFDPDECGDGRIGRGNFCPDCRERYVQCHECHRATLRANVTYNAHDEPVCDGCLAASYDRCSACDGWYGIGQLMLCDDDLFRCRKCAEAYGRERSVPVLEYHDFDADKYRPRRVDEGDSDERMLFGVELECERGAFDGQQFLWWVRDNDNLIHFEYDGSLDDGGVECVTMPCSLRFHRERMDWKRLCGVLEGQGFCSHDTENCGLHVHMDRSCLTPVQIVKMDVFFNRGIEFWSQIGRRRHIYDGEWNERKRGNPCKGRMVRDFDSRFQVLNTTNIHTVEIRFCRGTLNPETILGTLELFDAVPKFLDTISVARIYETKANIVRFIDYVADNVRKYPNAFPMMRRLVRTGWSGQVGMYYGKLSDVGELERKD